MELNGPAAGAGYDQIDVTGTVNVSGATLQVTRGYNPTPGTSFVIINNDDVDPVVGTFDGLPEGSVITVNGVPLVLSYEGGDGNDVTLTLEKRDDVWVNDTWIETANGPGTSGVVDYGDIKTLFMPI